MLVEAGVGSAGREPHAGAALRSARLPSTRAGGKARWGYLPADDIAPGGGQGGCGLGRNVA
eukprot:CAMPEP_0203920914 /NCGR_PEP_ID=MMETSP0359-20131031/61140_1 /ASSEMBLY_ACC=CAM_ASM_000338 /TAXON_ID=268821 /ORGANISM="Scrippsiella Hangoei, Strain SHTV-5" /LENGTH=60 /DNA_ID=CAMNT_0050848499 /DNA_START=13 /DNA_END=192 /DNA_ORIENTATION=-